MQAQIDWTPERDGTKISLTRSPQGRSDLQKDRMQIWAHPTPDGKVFRLYLAQEPEGPYHAPFASAEDFAHDDTHVFPNRVELQFYNTDKQQTRFWKRWVR